MGLTDVSLMAHVVDHHVVGHREENVAGGLHHNHVQVHHLDKQVLHHVLSGHHVVGVTDEVLAEVSIVAGVEVCYYVAVRMGMVFHMRLVFFNF